MSVRIWQSNLSIRNILISIYILYFLLNFKLLPGAKVVIANPESKGQCADAHLGEVNYQKETSYIEFDHFLCTFFLNLVMGSKWTQFIGLSNN